MDYKRIYDDLIEYRRLHPADGYTENHHILPSAMGGPDTPENRAQLTGREHWVAHLLLWKIHQNPEMAHASNMMAMRCEERGIPHIKNSRMYEAIRKICAKLSSTRNKITHRGSGNSQYGTIWVSHNEKMISMKIKKTGSLPEGWSLGRNNWKKTNGRPLKSEGRIFLDSPISITDGNKNSRLYFTDQLPIPAGWYIGMTYSEKTKMRVSASTSESNKNRKGIKYKSK